MGIPSRLVAGDTLTWTDGFAGYPASAGWQLAYRLINAAGKIDIAAVAAGDDYRVTVPAAVSAAWPAGSYRFVATLSRAGERLTVAEGAVDILPDLAAAASGLDARGPAGRALDDLRAALPAFIASNGQVAEFEIAGRRMRYRSVVEIETAIRLLEREAAREKAARGVARDLGGKAMVRF